MAQAVGEYLSVVRSLDLSAYRSGKLVSGLRMGGDDQLVVEYAPFDAIEREANLAIVGLTPGRTQAANSLEELRRQLESGASLEQALMAAKKFAAFSGAMRANLLAMLDAIGIPALFGRKHAEAFFAKESGGVHFTSALRYPVFLSNGDNYSGSPDPLKHAYLRSMIEIMLAEEAAALPDAVWVPVGKHAEAALNHLASKRLMSSDRIISGLPHPSGANAERIAYFLGRKARLSLSSKTNADVIDAAREKLARQVNSLALKRGLAR